MREKLFLDLLPNNIIILISDELLEISDVINLSTVLLPQNNFCNDPKYWHHRIGLDLAPSHITTKSAWGKIFCRQYGSIISPYTWTFCITSAEHLKSLYNKVFNRYLMIRSYEVYHDGVYYYPERESRFPVIGKFYDKTKFLDYEYSNEELSIKRHPSMPTFGYNSPSVYNGRVHIIGFNQNNNGAYYPQQVIGTIMYVKFTQPSA